nr:MAG TPA: Mor transcription activator family [Caudoviricetes sp.]
MNIGTEVNNLTSNDIYALMLFALYKLNDTSEYSSLSQLSYILDKENLLKLCQFYGGTTIYVPKIEELEDMLNALLMYQKVDIENMDIEEYLKQLKNKIGNTKYVQKNYGVVKDILKNYNFNSGR